LQFNLSHSQDLALYGFSIEQKIGVDLEYSRSISDVEKLAQRFFSAQEYKLISNCDRELKQQVFLQFWTAKEAYLKATGEGLVDALAEIEFAIEPEQTVSLLSIQGDKQIASNWLIDNFIPAPDYVATIAGERQKAKNSKPNIFYYTTTK
jgi:4'-phosphopantetheinyl transferase